VAVSIGSMNTVSMMQRAMFEAEVATQLFTNYFGPTPFKRLAVTQQTADNYGQSWPQLVWLPLSYFLDGTTRHQLYGFDPRGYFTAVAPHEIAHQWWGHTVTWGSYRDQWMSEGFSELSASLFLQTTGKANKEFLKFWNDEHSYITERNKEGYRAIDAGPVTLGYRLNNTKVGGNITRQLIYPKGGYILHMIRMLMWGTKTGDQDFKAMMRDFVATYRNKPATTEDFKAVVEKHMLPSMDMGGNGKMDWFFDEYVYGTALPSYRLDYSLDGMALDFTVTQSGVDDSFMMRVPLYLELADGRVARLGSLPIKGNSKSQQKVDLAGFGLKEKPKRVLLAYFADVLADKIEQR
jgi:aminopeptidase N